MEQTRRELEALYRDRHSQFVRMAMSLVGGDAAEANDVVQEAFARAYAKAGAFRRDGPLAGWVWRILLNHASHVQVGTTGRPVDEDAAPLLPDPGGDPRLAAALGALSTRQRTMVFLRFYADLTYDEIAVALDVRPGTVAATLHQSTELLRRLLGAQRVAK
jgi:RNA polymerase sigma-70 factor (ECF subfamily)